MIINNKNLNEKIPFCFEQKQASYSLTINHLLFVLNQKKPGYLFTSSFWFLEKDTRMNIVKS